MFKSSILERRQALGIATFAMPAVLLMLAVFVVPLGNVILQSITNEDTGAFTFAAYGRIA